MGYRTCYLCKYWSQSSGMCSVRNEATEESDSCPRIELIPCCASCKHWNKNYDYMDEGNCEMYDNQLSAADAICRAGYYTKR